MSIFPFAPLSERKTIAKKKQEPAFPVGKRVKKIALLDPNQIRSLTGFTPGNLPVPVGSKGTVVRVCSRFIKVKWDGVADEPLLEDPLFCCYDPVEQVICLEPIE